MNDAVSAAPPREHAMQEERIAQNFAAFDTNKDGQIEYREFVCGLSVILRGSPTERLQFVFRAYVVTPCGGCGG